MWILYYLQINIQSTIKLYFNDNSKKENKKMLKQGSLTQNYFYISS